jgi:hypothetical protein
LANRGATAFSDLLSFWLLKHHPTTIFDNQKDELDTEHISRWHMLKEIWTCYLHIKVILIVKPMLFHLQTCNVAAVLQQFIV